jgi:hypothetical protein
VYVTNALRSILQIDNRECHNQIYQFMDITREIYDTQENADGP